MDSGTFINLPNHFHSVSGSESRADIRLEEVRLGSVRTRGTLYTITIAMAFIYNLECLFTSFG